MAACFVYTYYKLSSSSSGNTKNIFLFLGMVFIFFSPPCVVVWASSTYQYIYRYIYMLPQFFFRNYCVCVRMAKTKKTISLLVPRWFVFDFFLWAMRSWGFCQCHLNHWGEIAALNTGIKKKVVMNHLKNKKDARWKPLLRSWPRWMYLLVQHKLSSSIWSNSTGIAWKFTIVRNGGMGNRTNLPCMNDPLLQLMALEFIARLFL